MNKAEKALNEINAMDRLAAQESPVHSLSPLSKLFITVLFIVTTVSFQKYDITGIFVMVLFPVFGYIASGIPVSQCFRKLRVVMPLVCAVGLVNPFFDREIIMHIGSVGVSGGVISMLTLMLKGVFSLMMSFLLIATTSIGAICRGLRQIHFPKILTSLIMLTYRYISVLLQEAAIMTQSYHLRAPGQKGINFRVWGSFLGQLILRSMDRASALYDGMVLRGFNGEFYYADARKAKNSGDKSEHPVPDEQDNRQSSRTSAISWASLITALIVGALIVLARVFNIAALVGSLFVR